MMSSDETSMKIPALTATNYFRWSVDVQCALDMRDLWSAVLEDEEHAALTSDEQRARKSRKARSFLLFYISPNLRDSVLHTTTAKQLWTRLEELYRQTSEDRNATLHQSLISAKQRSSEKMAEYISRLEGYVRELRERCNERISDAMFVGVMMNGVLPKYCDVISALRCLDSLQPESLKQKLIAAEERVATDPDRSRQSVPGQGRAFYSKPQHSQQRRSINTRRCYNCGQQGHYIRNCPQKKSGASAHVANGTNATALVSRALKPVHTELSDGTIEVKYGDDVMIDTGATHHVAHDRLFFVKMCAPSVDYVTCGGGEEHPVCGEGTVVLCGEYGIVRLVNTLYVPSFNVNLFSGSAACRHGATLIAEHPTLRVMLNARPVLTAESKNGLYCVKGGLLHLSDIPPHFFKAKAFVATTPQRWHQRLGHAHYDVLRRMQTHSTARNMEIQGPMKPPSEHCEACIEGKHERDSFPTSTSKTTHCLELVHADVIGKMPVASLGGSQYVLTILDDFSRFSAVVCVRRKSDVGTAFANTLALWSRQTGKLVKTVRTDGGSEFYGDFHGLLTEKGIIHQTSTRYTPQQNGAAERLNRTLVEKARCMLFQSHLPAAYWAEAISTANHVRNLLPSRLSSISHWEIFKGSKPDVSALRVFGCLAYAQVPKNLRNKLESCSEKGIHVGQAVHVKGWRILVPHDNGEYHIAVSRDVKFVEDVPGGTVAESGLCEPTEVDIDTLLSVLPKEATPDAEVPMPEAPADELQAPEVPIDEVPVANMLAADDPAENVPAADDPAGPMMLPAAQEAANDSALNPPAPTRQSTRVTSKPSRFDPCAYSYASAAPVKYDPNLNLTDDPQSIAEIMRRPDRELWDASMGEELVSLDEKHVYEWAVLPDGRKALPSRWVFKIKRTSSGAVDKYKSRVVAKGFMQKEGVDYNEVFAPGSNLASLRLLLSIAAADDLDIHQFDVKTAFLNGDLSEEVYMLPPPGVKGPRGQPVWRLRKALYGLKQAAQAWHAKLKTALTGVGLSISQSDPCLYTTSVDGQSVYLLVHVDDALIVGPPAGVAYVKDQFCKLFDVRDLGDANVFLGLEIARNRTDGLLWLGQSKYISDILNQFNMSDAVPRVSPMDANQQISAEGIALADDVPYRGAIGTLLYLAVCTRPDISHAVNMLSRYVSAPKSHHWQAVKGVMRYLCETRKLGLLYRKAGGPLAGYSDSDYAGDPLKRRSTSGYVFMHAGAAVLWGSKLQQTVAVSTCEAELIAGARAIKEALYLRKVWYDLRGEWTAITMKMDNQSALVLIKNPAAGAQNRSKHIDVAYHFARHRVMAGDIHASFIPTQRMLADIFTKQLPGPAFRMHRANLGVEVMINQAKLP